MYREESDRIVPAPTLVDGSGADGGFEGDFNFVEHLFCGQFDPLFAGANDIDLAPGGSVGILSASGDHRDPFDDGASVCFYTGRVHLLVKHFGGVNFGGITENEAVVGGQRDLDCFGVSGTAGFDFGDRGDGEGDGDLTLLGQVDLLIVDKASDHEFGF